MSFVDLMGHDRWSDADITGRSEAMVRSVISAERETILNRKLQGQALGQYEMTLDDLAELQLFNSTVFSAQAAAAAARVDRDLLHATLDAEPAYQRLQRAPLDPGAEGYEQDAAEREAAQGVIDGLPEPVLDLLALRNPVLEPEPEPVEG